ncbi:MAG: RpiB/LacA/LacB family sugar-phosphate isomerase, partial [Culicoidibacterales bacterium]
MMKIAIAADHGGVELKAEIVQLLNQLNYEVKDFGAFTTDS